MNIQKRKSISHKLDPKTASFLFSSSARVRHTRKLPQIDDRSLIANRLDSFKQPTYILEQAVYLANDIESIKKDLTPLRLQYESLRSTIDYSDTTQEDVDPLEEISRREGYSKLHRLQDEIRELDSQVSLLNTTFVDQSRNDLNAHVTEQYQMRAQFDVEIKELQEAIQIQKNELKIKEESTDNDKKIREEYKKNENKIKELREILSELMKQEASLLEQHKKTYTTKPKKEGLVQIELNLDKQLKSLQHISSQKRVELAKMQKAQLLQRKEIQGVIEEQKMRASQEKTTEMYIRNYQSRCVSNADDEEKEREYIQSLVDFYRDDNQQTEIVKTRIKRRHKRYHPTSKDGDKENNESSVNPHQSEANCSNIDPIETNDMSIVNLDEDETINSAAQNEEPVAKNEMSEEKVNDILMQNLHSLEMNINS